MRRRGAQRSSNVGDQYGSGSGGVALVHRRADGGA